MKKLLGHPVQLKNKVCQMVWLITEVRDLATGFGGTCEVEKES